MYTIYKKITTLLPWFINKRMLKLEFKTWPYYNQNLSLLLTGFVHTMYINTTIEHFDSVTPKILKPTLF